MSPISRHQRNHFHRGLLLLAVMSSTLMVSERQVSGAVLTSGVEFEDAHGKDCRCGTRCRGNSCCCGPRRSKLPKPAETPIQARPEAGIGLGAGLCMGAAPCSDQGLPTSPASTNPVGKVAAWAFDTPKADSPAGRFLPVPTRCIFPPPFASRLDEPPEGMTA